LTGLNNKQIVEDKIKRLYKKIKGLSGEGLGDSATQEVFECTITEVLSIIEEEFLLVEKE
jgi:hypothetical protein